MTIGRELWDIVRLPEPPRILCGCGFSGNTIREIHTFENNGQFRMDVHTICMNCGRHRVFGVHITKDEFYDIGVVKLYRVIKMSNEFWDTSVKPPRMKGRYICGCGCSEHYFKQLTVYEDHIQLFTKCKRCGSVKQFDIYDYDRNTYHTGERLHYSNTGHIIISK